MPLDSPFVKLFNLAVLPMTVLTMFSFLLQQAEKMVAYLQDSALDDERLAAKLQEQRSKGTSVPLHSEAMQKWFYKDPQGEIQGMPFSFPLKKHIKGEVT